MLRIQLFECTTLQMSPVYFKLELCLNYGAEDARGDDLLKVKLAGRKHAAAKHASLEARPLPFPPFLEQAWEKRESAK